VIFEGSPQGFPRVKVAMWLGLRGTRAWRDVPPRPYCMNLFFAVRTGKKISPPARMRSVPEIPADPRKRRDVARLLGGKPCGKRG